ncbi:acyl-CoA/acyl-ACP dehydrogenase [Sphingomonas sp. So64.6b]|uniref:acyl-CoA dehydrogenase family protein n=1 Tax=Sphingomonas sp. So64.6b TaxID=2997354 RepID=UPI0015FFF159|nr:acyl-CoA dehydrogenase family protein [Sphingomonas sp. So64.6b]QNA86644.1 acyl-CoA/acyl-ACP dehydrogenase [Sphingomonas sp. So64.6b]
MNVDYDEDVRALMDHARKLLDARGAIDAARRVLETAGDTHATGLWRELGAQGWCGVAIDDAHGGLGMASVALAGLAEELGRSLAPVPFASSIYGFAQAIALAGSETQRAALLPEIASGALIGTLAFTEGPGTPFAAPPTARVERGRLHGTKQPVTDGAIADWAVVLAATADGPGLFVVGLNDPGVTRRSVSTLDPTRPAARLDFADVPVEPVGRTGDGVALAAQILTRYAVPLAFEAIGGADACLEMAVAYTRTRFAFGRPVAGYQAVKHRLADIYVKNEMARSNAYYAAWAADHDPAVFESATAAARIAACEAYWFAAKELIQLHGGIGFTWEMDCHLFYRRARHLSTAAGAPDWWRARLADQLRQVAA